MIALTINGLQVRVSVQDGARGSDVVPGDFARAFDATGLRIFWPDRKKQEWHCITTPLTQAAADALSTELYSSLPLVVGGELVRGITLNCYAFVTARAEIGTGTALREVIEFDLREI